MQSADKHRNNKVKGSRPRPRFNQSPKDITENNAGVKYGSERNMRTNDAEERIQRREDQTSEQDQHPDEIYGDVSRHYMASISPFCVPETIVVKSQRVLFDQKSKESVLSLIIVMNTARLDRELKGLPLNRPGFAHRLPGRLSSGMFTRIVNANHTTHLCTKPKVMDENEDNRAVRLLVCKKQQSNKIPKLFA